MIRANPLSLLAYKVKPNLFDLGAGLAHVSIRDQLVRATLLVRDLKESGQLQTGQEILFVGAGAAGITGALAAAAAGAKAFVVDCQSAPFELFKGITERHVGAYLYEWPSAFYDDQCFPPASSSTLSHWLHPNYCGLEFGKSAPVSADQLYQDWTNWLLSAGRLNSITLLVDVPKADVKSEIKTWHESISPGGMPSHTISLKGSLQEERSGKVVAHSSVTHSLNPRHVVLAGGFGQERTAYSDPHGLVLASGAPFWQNDNLLAYQANMPTIVIFGGGDGALQDVLRALTGKQTPLDVLAALGTGAAWRALTQSLSSLAAFERQHELLSIWEATRKDAVGNDISDVAAQQSLHNAFSTEAAELAKDWNVWNAMISTIRSDVSGVHLILRDNYFSKAYALNRFLVLLFHALAQSNDFAKTGLDFKIHYRTVLDSCSPLGSSPTSLNLQQNGSPFSIPDVNITVVRLGVDQSQTIGQQIGLTALDTQNRQDMARIRVPFWPL